MCKTCNTKYGKENEAYEIIYVDSCRFYRYRSGVGYRVKDRQNKIL
ncbi:protein of unknown function [[Clostridium] ultunense Esp]|uniref:Uncharacterized protein n=1 Tax=[Clostridium] ultunense Esp TaxID=1288971 RepID=A0A1M4PJP7_9FIRM|nr:protein of unknown function [[Clostridium] ultunense Esp]